MLVLRCLLSVCAQPMAFRMIFISEISKASSQTESMIVSESVCCVCIFKNPFCIFNWSSEHVSFRFFSQQRSLEDTKVGNLGGETYHLVITR